MFSISVMKKIISRNILFLLGKKKLTVFLNLYINTLISALTFESLAGVVEFVLNFSRSCSNGVKFSCNASAAICVTFKNSLIQYDTPLIALYPPIRPEIKLIQ